MFKLFNRSKRLQSPTKAPLKKEVLSPGPSKHVSETLAFIDRSFDDIELEIKRHKAIGEMLANANREQQREIIALKGIVANLRKQKVYAGQRFYDPKNHKAPVVYLCARWNEWYMIRRQNQTTPLLITAEHWTENFGHYELMPRTNTNLRNLG